MALDILPSTWTAIVFLLLGLILVVLEVVNPGFFIAVPGGTLFIMGSLGLIWPDLMFNSPFSWAAWPAAAMVSTLANLYFYKRWAPPGDKPDTLTNDSMPGEEGRATVEIVPGRISGKVLVKGSTWSARVEEGEAPIPAGTRVRVVRAEGVHLIVEPLKA